LMRCVGRRRVIRRASRPFLVDRGADVGDGRASCVHHPGASGDVQAHGTFHPVVFPLDDVPVHVARLDEAVFVAAMTASLAPAEARDVAQHLGMFGGKPVRGGHHFRGPRHGIAGELKWREIRLRMCRELVRARCARRRNVRRSLSVGGWAAAHVDGPTDNKRQRHEPYDGQKQRALWRSGYRGRRIAFRRGFPAHRLLPRFVA